MNLNQLYYFQKLAAREHYTQAAAELHISQPSLSKAIANLENELGVYLFEKDGRNVKLTRSGKRYLEFVNAALLELEAGNNMMRREQSMSDGYIDIGLISSIENDSFPQWVRSFQEAHGKKVFFSCKNGTSQELADGLMEDRFDLIFCTAVLHEPLIEFVPVLEQKLVLVCPSGHRFAGRQSISLTDLTGEAIIPHTADSAIRPIVSDLFEMHHVQIRAVSEAEEDRTILGLVQAGLGCSIMTDSSGIYVDGVCVIPLTGIDYHRYVCMGWRRDRPRPPMAELFRKHVLREAAYTG